jgi:hypothetical protein
MPVGSQHQKARIPSTALGNDLSAVQFDQMPHDRQPQSQSPIVTSAAAVRLTKTLEDMGQEFGADSDAGIND